MKSKHWLIGCSDVTTQASSADLPNVLPSLQV